MSLDNNLIFCYDNIEYYWKLNLVIFFYYKYDGSEENVV